MECAVCTDSFNKSFRKPVECLHCGFQACQKCVERFLLENTIVPKCMSCNVEWNMEYLRSKLPRSFMDKEYRNHQKGALQVQEEANFGLYQGLIQRDRRLKELTAQEAELQRALSEVRREINRVRYTGGEGGGAAETEEQRAVFFMACPANDCRGRLSTAYKCGLCSHYFCPDCHGDKGLERNAGDHECNKDDVETVKMLEENTRPCPKCHMGIYKTEGCDQMWCTSCHTCFSWRTGNVLNGVIHNPHFYEWQRQNGGGHAPRVAGDVPCGGMPHFYHVERRFRHLSKPLEWNRHQYITKAHRVATHLQYMTMPNLQMKMRQRPAKKTQVGMNYLEGKIDKKTWLDAVYRFSREEEKYRRYFQVVESLVFSLSEIFRQFIGDLTISGALIENNIEKVLELANEEIRKMNKQYNAKMKEINVNMDTGNL